MLTLAIVLGASYLLGSIPFGYLAGRIAGVDSGLSGNHPAAIHVDHLTGNVPGRVRSQERDGFGDLLRLAETLKRVHRDCQLGVIGRDSPLRLPFPRDRAGGKRVNADFRGQVPGQGVVKPRIAPFAVE